MTPCQRATITAQLEHLIKSNEEIIGILEAEWFGPIDMKKFVQTVALSGTRDAVILAKTILILLPEPTSPDPH